MAVRLSSKAWNDANKERVAATTKRWRENNPLKVRASGRVRSARWAARFPERSSEKTKKSHLKKRYGLTLEQADALGSICMICGAPFSTKGSKVQKRHIDHDHATDLVRGVLCGHCNTGLGAFKDSVDLLATAITYLQTHGVKRDP